MNLKLSFGLSLMILCSLTGFAQRKGYWEQKVDYTMEIDVDEKTYQYDGKMNLKYSNNSGQELMWVRKRNLCVRAVFRC